MRQLCPDERITRLRDFVWLMVGIYQSKSVHLSDIASKIPGRAKELSIVRRLSRFLANPVVRVHAWYAPVARDLLQSMARTVGEVRSVADGTKVGFNHQPVDHRHRLPSSGVARCRDLDWMRQGPQQRPQTTGLADLRTRIGP